MIISKTPFRISFLGGGLDFESWFSVHDSYIFSMPIEQYSYVQVKILPKDYPFKYRLRTYNNQDVNNVDQIENKAIKGVISYFDIKSRLEITHFADLPSRSGLGSSSAFLVGLIKSVDHCLINNNLSQNDIAKIAVEIEKSITKDNVGYQDQYGTAIGNLKFIKMSSKGIDIEKVTDSKFINNIENSAVIINSGIYRNSSDIQHLQLSANDKGDFVDIQENLSSISKNFFQYYKNGKISYNSFITSCVNQWKLKHFKQEKLGLEKNELKAIYKMLDSFGVNAYKNIGAGGGGYILVLVDPPKMSNFLSKFRDLNPVRLSVDVAGTRSINLGDM